MRQPFLKWAGSKRQSVERILPELNRPRYIEPFCGSAVVALNVPHKSIMIGDSNPDLGHLYRNLARHGEEFIKDCRSLFVPENNTVGFYDAARYAFNTSGIVHRSALFVYLNRHGYNGLCRYNRSGWFNVPFGCYTKPYFPEKEMREFCAWANQPGVRICDGDFEPMMRLADHNCVVYCDPPFWPISSTASFVGYDGQPFGSEEQERLADCARNVRKRGGKVVISNHFLPETERLYADASRIVVFEARRAISCDGENRKPVQEMMAVYE